MDQQQTQNINRAAEQLTDSTRQSLQTIADRTLALQESNLRLTQGYIQGYTERLQSQTQGNREAAQNLQEQSQRQRETFETLSREATNAYSGFLNSALSFYQEALNTASRVARSNVPVPGQAVEQTAPAWDESEHSRDTGGRFYQGTEVWDESEHPRDTGGQFTQ